MNYFTYQRIKRGWSQKDLAEKLNLNPVTVCRVENGWYAKAPKGLNSALRKVFGKEWSFDLLMQPVPDLPIPDNHTLDQPADRA